MVCTTVSKIPQRLLRSLCNIFFFSEWGFVSGVTHCFRTVDFFLCVVVFWSLELHPVNFGLHSATEFWMDFVDVNAVQHASSNTPVRRCWFLGRDAFKWQSGWRESCCCRCFLAAEWNLVTLLFCCRHQHEGTSPPPQRRNPHWWNHRTSCWMIKYSWASF